LTPQHQLTLGPLTIVFHKTERVPDEATNAALPPSLGRFPIYNVRDFRGSCPNSWNEKGIFIPVQGTEAMWMSFSRTTPIALTVGAGGINAVTGKRLAANLEEGGYLVTPPQPWLDGWKGTDGTVRQFVCAEYKGGEGLTVGEQLIGKESKTGGIAFAVFESDKRLPGVHTPGHYYNGVPGKWNSGVKLGGVSNLPGIEFVTLDAQLMPCASASSEFYGAEASYSAQSLERSTAGRLRKSMAEMGVGAGGRITQKIYPDPYGLDVWKGVPSYLGYLYLVSAEDFADITGQKLTAPAEQKHPGFKMVDGHLADVNGTTAFDNLKPATAAQPDKAFFPG
jgi:hypothetical protein